MKKVYAINGSPRINWNTSILLDKVLEGVKEIFPDAETERIDLYKLKYTGCTSCFACKMKDGPNYGKCPIKDDLYPILQQLREADAVIFGSPIYYRTITGMLHSFYERMFYPFMTYNAGYPTLVENHYKTICIYTMNVNEKEMITGGYRENMELWEFFLEKYFNKPEILFAFNTLQFKDYSKYVCETFNQKDKEEYRKDHFPEDCLKAFEMGKNLFKEQL